MAGRDPGVDPEDLRPEIVGDRPKMRLPATSPAAGGRRAKRSSTSPAQRLESAASRSAGCRTSAGRNRAAAERKGGGRMAVPSAGITAPRKMAGR